MNALIGSELVSQLNQSPGDPLGKRVTPAQVEAILPKVMEVGAGHFREFWFTTLDDAERTLLRQMVSQTAPEEIPVPLRRSLINKEVLDAQEDGALTFQVPLIQRYAAKMSAEGY
jgi:hypothetical protein